MRFVLECYFCCINGQRVAWHEDNCSVINYDLICLLCLYLQVCVEGNRQQIVSLPLP